MGTTMASPDRYTFVTVEGHDVSAVLDEWRL
jgi:hypothetical protein